MQTYSFILKIIPIMSLVIFLNSCSKDEDYLKCSSQSNNNILKQILKNNFKSQYLSKDEINNLLLRVKDVSTKDINELTRNRECKATVELAYENMLFSETIEYDVIKLEKSESTHMIEIATTISMYNLYSKVNSYLDNKQRIEQEKINHQKKLDETKKRVQEEKLKIEKKLNEAIQNGFDTIIKYEEYQRLENSFNITKEKLDTLVKNFKILKKNIVTFKQKNLYISKNKFIAITGISYTLKNRHGNPSLFISFKNISNYKIKKIHSDFHLFDQNFEYIGSFRDNDLNDDVLNPNKSIKVEISGTIYIDRDIVKAMVDKKKFKLVLTDTTVNYKDEYGEDRIRIQSNEILKRLKNINPSRVNKIKIEIKKYKEQLERINKQKNILKFKAT